MSKTRCEIMDKSRRGVLRRKRQLNKHSSLVENVNNISKRDNIMSAGDQSQGAPSTSNKCSSKLHSKTLIDRFVVDHANVPRKLRSAMNKRSRVAVSPLCSDIKKLHHATLETKVPRSKGVKKFKQNLKQEGAADQTGLRPITKDEEEVAETLFSLAKMSPNDMPRANRRTSDVKLSPLQEAKASAELVTQAPNENSTASQRICFTTDLASLSSNLEGSSYQNSSPQLTVMGRPIGTGNNRFDLALDSSTVLADILWTSLSSRDANTKDIPLTDPTEIGVFTEFCRGTGSVQLAQHKVHLHKQKLRNGLWPVVNAVRIEEAQLPASGHKGSGTILACTEGAAQFWPGMSRVSHGREVHGPCTWSPSTEREVRLDPSSGTGSTTTSVLTENLKPVVVDQRQSWKRCAAHVYISHLIQAHRTAEKIPRWPALPDHLKSVELGATNHLNGLRTGLNNVICVDGTNALNIVTSKGSTDQFALEKSPNELQIGDLKGKRIQKEQWMPISSSGTSSSEKKSSIFLPLSAGVGDLEPLTTSTTNTSSSDSYQGGIKVVSSAQAQVPYLLPVVQRSPLIAFTLPNVPFVYSQSQLPQNMSSPYYYRGHHAVGISKQQMEQYLWCGQQQQRAAQLAMQFRPGVSHHDSLLNHCARPSLSCYFPEMCNANGSQQQQPFAISSSLRSYDERGLKLVCSAEHT